MLDTCIIQSNAHCIHSQARLGAMLCWSTPKGEATTNQQEEDEPCSHRAPASAASPTAAAVRRPPAVDHIPLAAASSDVTQKRSGHKSYPVAGSGLAVSPLQGGERASSRGLVPTAPPQKQQQQQQQGGDSRGPSATGSQHGLLHMGAFSSARPPSSGSSQSAAAASPIGSALLPGPHLCGIESQVQPWVVDAVQEPAVRMVVGRHDVEALLPLATTVGPLVQSRGSSGRLGETADPSATGLERQRGHLRRHQSSGCAITEAAGSSPPNSTRHASYDLANLSRIVQLCTRGRPLDVAMAELRATRERLQPPGRGNRLVPMQRARRSFSLSGQVLPPLRLSPEVPPRSRSAAGET